MVAQPKYPLSRSSAAIRRLFDVGFAASALLMFSPLLLMVAGLVKLTSSGPALYVSERVGRGGVRFKLYKFRSMVFSDSGARITGRGDSRITAVGRWLRKSKIDELPQLYNVLRGDMSVVGPRPEDPYYVEAYTSEQQQVLNDRPGLTGAASLEYVQEEEILSSDDWEMVYRSVILPKKISIELDYARRRTLRSDLAIILRTGVVLLQPGRYLSPPR